jgi:hypothetical protein
MGRDNQPKARQATKLARKKARRASYDRILVVSEGSKTEPQYFEEIRSYHRLHTANVQVHPGALGTKPVQVVEYGERLFTEGDPRKGIQARAFEQIYAVFDRDDHDSYHHALAKAAALDGRLRNDLRERVKFQAIASVPCFELWLLLHFEDVFAPLQRTEVYRRLRQHLPGYDKGQTGHFNRTLALLDLATQRATHLVGVNTAHDGTAPYTDVHRLVSLLTTLKSE